VVHADGGLPKESKTSDKVPTGADDDREMGMEKENSEKCDAERPEPRPRGALDFVFQLGSNNGMPRFTVFLGIVQGSTLFIPESVLSWIGLSYELTTIFTPQFVQYYVMNSDFKNAMALFWVISPVMFVLCTTLYTKHVNGVLYSAYMSRRALRLKKLGKSEDFSLVVGGVLFLLLYVWSTVFYHREPIVFGEFVPIKNRYAMLFLHAGSVGFVLPIMLAMVITEVRSIVSTLLGTKE